MTALAENSGLQSNTVVKPSAGAQMVSDASLLQRQAFNFMYATAKPNLLHATEHKINLHDLARGIDYTSRNLSYLKDLIKDLRTVHCEWNVFGKDPDKGWETYSVLIAEVEFRGSDCYYHIPPRLSALLANPNLYFNLDLEVQKRFKHKYALSLWEFLVDVLGAKRNHVSKTLTLEDIRRLLNVKSKSSQNFKYLQRDVLQPAMEEINSVSNISIEMEPLRDATGRAGPRKVSSVKFSVKRKAANETLKPIGQGDLGLSFEDPDFIQTTLVTVFRVNPGVVRKVRAKYSDAKIKEYITYTDQQNKEGKVSNKAAFFIKAIESNWETGLTSGSAGPEGSQAKKTRNEINETKLQMQNEVIEGEAYYNSLMPDEKFNLEQEFVSKAPSQFTVELDVSGNNVHSSTRLQNAFYRFALNKKKKASSVVKDI